MKRLLLASLLLASFAFRAIAAEGVEGVPGLYRYKLANGLEVYAYRDDAVPLARVELVFRSGAISQGPESAGLFRLYERALLRGSKGRPGAAGLKASLASLGATEWKGGVGTERSEYWIRLPSSKVREGISFWAGIFASPLLDEVSLEEEKQIQIGEIRAEASDPDSIYEAGYSKRLFSKYPWRRDPAGSEKAVRGATMASLAAAVGPWLVPNNAALFVGGNVDPEEVRAAAEEAFGKWAAGPDPWAKPLPPNPRLGVPRPTWLVFPDTSMPEGLGRIEVRYRGPDIAVDPASSYAADLWSALAAPPNGRFKAALEANVPKLAAQSIVASYVSQRDGGWISISAFFDVDSESPAIERARGLKERTRADEITAMKADKAYFSEGEYAEARERLLRDRAAVADTAEGMIGNLAFWWATASIGYYADYPAALARIGPKELSAFLDTYVMRNLEVVALRMNPIDIEREKAPFASSGFQTVDASNAFWWQK
jgi:zinc protease